MGIQELGPRFTLKLRSLQKGTFDSKYGEYEWVHKVCAYSMKSHLGNFKKDGMRIKPCTLSFEYLYLKLCLCIYSHELKLISDTAFWSRD